MRQRAILIGGGLGNLAAALTLCKHYDVTIIEKEAKVGGKMQRIDVEGYPFDFGPNTLTMPHYFWTVVAPFGKPQALLPFEKLAQPTQHQLGAHTVTFSTDVDEMVAQLAQIDATSAANYPQFLAHITVLFQRSERAFLNKTFFSARDYVSPSLALELAQAYPHETLQQFLQRYFPHPSVQQLFARFATYIGSSPYLTPATFALIAYFELVEGTYFLRGGAPRIAECFEQLLREQGVTIVTNASVEKIAIDDECIRFVETAKQRYEGELFISGIEYEQMQRLLERKPRAAARSTSAYVELIGLHAPVPLHYHNVLFSADYEAEFTALVNGRYANEPTVYSCYPYAADETRKPGLFVLINAPHDQANDEQQRTHVNRALATWGITEEQIAARRVLPPSFIAKTFAVQDGAIYGQASNDWRGSFFRPRNRDAIFSNLYYVGGTVHPGGGSPIVVKGGYEVARRIIKQAQNG